jgi:drug/metabolite transporter (DMT)-like permease
MNWFIASILALILIIAYRILAKHVLSQNRIEPTTFSILESFATLILSTILVAIFGFEFSGGPGEIALIILNSMIAGSAALLMTISLKHISASQYQIISSSRILITMITGIALFQEDLSFTKILSGILVVFAIVLVTFQKNSFKLTKYHLLALASSVLFGIVFTGDKHLSNYFNNFSMVMLTFLFSQIFKLALTPKNFKLIPKAFRENSSILPTIITGSFLAGIYLFQYYAYQVGGNLSAVNIILGTSTVFIVFFSTIFLGEKRNLVKKIIGSIIVSIAVILIKVG